METHTQHQSNPVNTSVPLHVVHELVGRMTAAPELKQVLTEKLKSHNHGQSLKMGEIEKVFDQIKFERAGSHDAFHIEQLHKTLTAHMKSFGGLTALSGPSHPSLSHL